MSLSRRHALKLFSTGLLFSADILITGPSALAATPVPATGDEPRNARDAGLRDRLHKAADFERDYATDVILTPRVHGLLEQTTTRLERLKRYVGYANFSLLSFDEALRYGRGAEAVGAFSRAETELLEALFFADARRYGFWGEKVIGRITDDVKQQRYLKVPGSGHYLYRGRALTLYRRLRRDVGEELILTSGIRGIVKQMHLFMAKARRCGGNLSRASRSLAPPGHSYHGIGDFDVGARGMGRLNFSRRFADTQVYRRLCELDYLQIRYTERNPYGVRYEPWHIKVIESHET